MLHKTNRRVIYHIYPVSVEYLEGRCTQFPRKRWRRFLHFCRYLHLLHIWSSFYLEHSGACSARCGRSAMKLLFGDVLSWVMWSHHRFFVGKCVLPLTSLSREKGRFSLAHVAKDKYCVLVCLLVCFLHYTKPFQLIFQSFPWCQGQQQSQFQPSVAAAVGRIRTMWSQEPDCSHLKIIKLLSAENILKKQ